MKSISWKQFIPVGLIICIAVFFRFVYLDKIPNSISGDELLYVTTAKSVFLTGHDLTGTWNPLSAFIFRYPPNEQQAELPYFIHLFFSAPFPFSLFLVKLPFALMSVGIVILLYKIANLLFGKNVGIATGLIAAINPWLVVMGRTGYESTPATFFYLLALYLLLTLKKWKLLIAIIPFTLAFYSYIGTKLIFIPFVCISLILAYIVQKQQYARQYILIGVYSLLFVLGFIILFKSSSSIRMSELVLPDSPVIVSQVNEIRKTALRSFVLPLTVNKYTIYIEFLVSKLFRVLAPSYLFVEGDEFFLPGIQGFFYYIDALFILLGMVTLYAKKRLYFFITCLFIVLGTFPHLFHRTTGDFSGHLALMFPFVIILIGAGVAESIENKSKKIHLIAISTIIIVYLLNISAFSMLYFYRYPLMGYSDFHMRVLSHYLTIKKNTNTPITIYSNTSRDLFKKYLFYTDGMTKQTINEIRKSNTKSSVLFNNIQFTSCDDKILNAPENNILISDTLCGMHINGPHLRISKLTDGGGIYEIVNDTVCSSYALNTYPRGITTNDFAIETLSDERFCNIYINK
jgi:hypothetical protein